MSLEFDPSIVTHCLVCNLELVKRTKRHVYCSRQCKSKHQYVLEKRPTDKYHYKYISGNWDRYLQKLCNRRAIKATLDGPTCREILIAQDYRCALSGVELTCNLKVGERCWTNASLDRIEAGGPYIKDNVQIVCAAINMFRVAQTVDEFIWWCKKVAEYNAS